MLVVFWLLLLLSLPSNANSLNSTWSGDYNTGYWGGLEGGEVPNMIPNGSGFVWGYGGGIISNTIAINQAIQDEGVQVEGYSYVWRVKNANTNLYELQGDVDPFSITVDVYKADGTLYTSYVYDYTQFQGWTTHEGSETFADQFLDPAFFGNMTISAEGNDAGYWAGHWGPEFDTSQSSLTLTYSSNPCYNNPLYDPACIGYAEAIAELILEQQELAIASIPEQEIFYEEPIQNITSNENSMGMENTQTQSQSSSSSNQDDTEKKETKEKKLKEAAKEIAAGLQEQIVESENMSEQQLAQAEMLVMMNYAPGFNSYKLTLPGGTYPDVPFYPPSTMPDSKSGARNNLAQQLLHQEMIDMQYRR